MLHHAVREANKSSYKFKLGAIVTRKGKIIGRGFNALRYSTFSHPSFSLSLHAEAAALKNIRGKMGDTILVVRVNNSGSLGMAKPCINCLSKIKDAGISWVVFSNNKGVLEKRRVDDLIHESEGSSSTDCPNDGEDLPQL